MTTDAPPEDPAAGEAPPAAVASFFTPGFEPTHYLRTVLKLPPPPPSRDPTTTRQFLFFAHWFVVGDSGDFIFVFFEGFKNFHRTRRALSHNQAPYSLNPLKPSPIPSNSLKCPQRISLTGSS